MILTNKLFLTCPRGLEEVLTEEIKLISGKESSIDAGGVHLTGSQEDIFKINLETRTSMLVLQEISTFSSNNIN